MENAPAQNLELLQARPIQEGTYDEMEAAQAAERAVEVAETQPEVVEEQSILARAGARVGEFVRDHTPRKLTAGLAVAAIAVGGAVKTSNHSAEKAEAAPTASKTLGPNALKKLCKNAIFRMPQVPVRALGRQNEKQTGQDWYVATRNYLVPAVCNDKYQRIMSMRREVQNPTHPKRWRKAEAPNIDWYFLMAGNKGIGDKTDPNFVDLFKYGNHDYSTSQSLHYDMNATKVLYRCAPGRRKSRARVKIRNQVKDLDNGKIIGVKTRNYPVNVTPAC